MKKVFRLEGLGCANCAAKMEMKIGELDGVDSVSVNFITTKLVIEAEDDKMDSIIKSAEKIIRKIEPDTKLKKA
ncbi:MAG TPA: heavy metal transporter [Clostridiales bacterium]|nr:heavy metal transporter [Clostridiales bacterium]